MRAAMVVMVLAAGCTRANVGAGGPFLDGAVQVSAAGTRPRSMVSLQRGGTLDPASTAMEVMVRDADVALHRKDGRATIDHVKLLLDDVDLPPSADLPHGLSLREISLQLEEPLHATVEEASADTLVVTAMTPLYVHSSMLLSDGTLYKLGNTETEPGQLTIRVTVDGDKATATVDAAPPATCWQVDLADHHLLQAQNCALFVESFAKVQAL